MFFIKMNKNHNAHWTEKYRPKNIDDVVCQTNIVNILKKSINDENLSHYIFYGPPGTGKTSVILAAAKKLFNKDIYQDYVLELNASDERGINVIRKRVRMFAQKLIRDKNQPQFKLIILDEADSLTIDAQHVLRHTIDNYSKITRFCLICNYINKIIIPLRSRCTKFRFVNLDKQSVCNIFKNIFKNENIKITNNVCEKIYEITKGDMRKGINTLQSLYQIFGENIQIKDINEMYNIIPNDIYINIIKEIKTNLFENIQNISTIIIDQGYSISKIIEYILEKILYDNLFNEIKKSKIAIYLAKTDKNLVCAADSYFQLMDVLLYIMEIYHE